MHCTISMTSNSTLSQKVTILTRHGRRLRASSTRHIRRAALRPVAPSAWVRSTVTRWDQSRNRISCVIFIPAFLCFVQDLSQLHDASFQSNTALATSVTDGVDSRTEQLQADIIALEKAKSEVRNMRLNLQNISIQDYVKCIVKRQNNINKARAIFLS